MCYLQVAPFGKGGIALFSMDSAPYVIIPFCQTSLDVHQIAER